MKNIIKVAFLSSVITAALVYVILEWRPLRSELSRPPEVSSASSTTSAEPPAAPAGVNDDEKNNIDLYQRYGPGVVNITTTTLAYDFFLRPVPMEGGSGSGAIIDSEGHIVTNHHVIEGARRLEVTLWDKSKYPARVIGDDPNHDLAVIKVDAPKGKLKPIPLGTSKNLLVGQKVLAIGNPYGLERTLTTGIISSLGRAIQTDRDRVIDDVIQTDAAINPGNSGGPLLNSTGEIIGINTAIYSPSSSGGSIGIGFAIPADTVRDITGSLIKLGYVPRPYLGIANPIDLSDYPLIVDALRLNTDHGLMVTRVNPNSPADKAGIRGASSVEIIGNVQVPIGGDVILAVEGRDVGSLIELNSIIDKFKPGDRVTVNILRSGRKMDVPVTLAEYPQRR
jgi:S1-C subfamily serine protease